MSNTLHLQDYLFKKILKLLDEMDGILIQMDGHIKELEEQER